MSRLMEVPPYSPVEPVTDILHGIPVVDSYRWLEEQDSPKTRAWIDTQTLYARGYLDAIPGRETMRKRIREFLAVETHDSIQKVANRYFFRKRLPEQEQPCIYMREGADGEDQVLLDPARRDTGRFTAVKPLCVSPDGRLLLYEVKQGGERTGTFELFDVETRCVLPDMLPRGYLRGFAFHPDGQSFYYVHEATGARKPHLRAAYQHALGTTFDEDREIFTQGEDERFRLILVAGDGKLGFLGFRFFDTVYTEFFLWEIGSEERPRKIIENAGYSFAPVLFDGRILAVTDRDAPNRRIVEVHTSEINEPVFFDVVPETDAAVQDWTVTRSRIYVVYTRLSKTEIAIFTRFGEPEGTLPVREADTVRIIFGNPLEDELVLECESFTKPVEIYRYQSEQRSTAIWSRRKVPFEARDYAYKQVWFTAKDDTRIPMFLAGRSDVLVATNCPTVMTSYGGYGVSMTPQFSVFVAFLMERGCLFALPNIRGGSEFGTDWHNAAKRRNRQVAFDDFLAAAEWLIATERTQLGKLAIFGGSNSGLLVCAAMTQRPELFRAVLCMVPMTDMLRYHLFDNAHVWKEEFGTVDDPEDSMALLRYSPYHAVRQGTTYPATMIVSGDADQNCNPLHARKMTAALQAANVSKNPIVLDYSRFRGHSPVLPLGDRVEALTDRIAFFCDQLGLTVGTGV